MVALQSVDLAVSPGEVVGLLGPNGSGKTTIMRCAAGVLSPSHGSIRIAGASPIEARGEVGLVLRDDRTFHHRLSGWENLRLFARLQRLPERLAKTRIEDALTAADLNEVAERTYRTYSAGMRQRLSFARALLAEPKLLLLDEATTGLDPGVRQHFVEVVKTLVNERDVGVLWATHDLHEAEEVCDRLLLMQKGEILAQGTYDEIRDDIASVFGLAK
ncbi:MAG: ABC-2 type transport system ATP-binding protein [Bradymonadia bacterium]